MCGGGRIEGAIQIGREWLIPKNMEKPVDGRTKAGKKIVDRDMPLPRKTPFLYMSDLYNMPGMADRVAESLAYNHEAQVLFEAEVAYSRGEIDKVYESANYLLNKHSGFFAILSAGMLLAMCAIWKGDIEMWRKAKIHISEAPAKNDIDRDVMQLAISAVDIMIYNVESFPEWFKIGRFDPIHKDSYPAAMVYYAKYLYALGYAVAMGLVKVEGTQGLYTYSRANVIVPAFCNLAGREDGRVPCMTRYTDGMEYFDAAHLAAFIDVPITIPRVSLGDTNCSPNGILSMFNNIPKGIHKEINFLQNSDHNYIPEPDFQQWYRYEFD